jgi:hypothetical protein
MDAIIVDLKDFAVRTSEQVVRVFFGLYDEASVRSALWEVFRLYAVNDEKGITALDKQEAKVALLFDHLIDLVEAIGILRTGKSAERCVVCGKTDT